MQMVENRSCSSGLVKKWYYWERITWDYLYGAGSFHGMDRSASIIQFL